MNRRTRFLVTAASLAGLASAAVTAAGSVLASDPRIAAVPPQLRAVAQTVDRMATLAELVSPVPLTQLNPAGGSGLGLEQLLDDAFARVGSVDTVDGLRSALEGVASDTGAPLSYWFGCQSGDSCSTPVTVTESGGTLTLQVPVRAQRTVSAPLAIDTASFDLPDGQLSADLAISTTLDIVIDLNSIQTTPSSAVAVQPTSAGTFTVALAGTQPEFTTSFGFTNVSGRAGGTGGVSVPFTLRDPDGSGGATLAELTVTDIRDLVQIGAVDRTLAATVALDSDLTPTTSLATTPDLHVAFSADDPPVITGGLDAFKRVGRDQVFAGVAQLASALQAVQSSADIRLPLLQDGLASITKAAQPLFDYVAANSVICGPADAPGSEVPATLLAGLVVLCQASVLVPPGQSVTSATWSVSGGRRASDAGVPADKRVTDDRTTGASALPTVGSPASEKAAFYVENPATFAAQVAYRFSGDTADRTAQQPPLTAQAMVQRLVSVAGFESNNVLAYDASKQVLTFRLRKTIPAPTPLDSRLDVGDKLAEIGITGVGDSGGSAGVDPNGATPPAGTATLRVAPSGVEVDLTFGVVLTETVQQINAAESGSYTMPQTEADRFFVQAPASAPLLSMEDVEATGDIDLSGRAGFLGFTLTAPETGATAFSLVKPDENADALSVTATLPGFGVTPDGATTAQTITNAIQFRNLDQVDLATAIVPTVNLGARAGLTATALVGSTALLTGTLTVTVPDARRLAQPTATDDGITVTADVAFRDDLLGFAGVGGTDNPAQMLGILTALLDTLVTQILDQGGALEEPLPLIGRSPKELLQQLQSLRQAVSEISGAPGPVITCADAFDGTGAPVGSAEARPADGTLECRATSTKPATDVVWTADGGTVAVATPLTTVGQNPTSSAIITLDSTATHLAGTPGDPAAAYAVHLSFRDDDGAHSAHLPALQTPSTLQGFMDMLTRKLGLPAGSLTAAVDEVKEGASGTPKRALVLGLHLGLCTSDRDALPAGDVRKCAGNDAVIAPLTAPLAFDLGGVGGIATVQGQAPVTLSTRAAGDLRIAVPLKDPASTGSYVPAPLVLGGSGVVLDLGAHSNAIDVSAALGPFTAQLGLAAERTAGTPGVGKLRLGLGFTARTAGAADEGTAPGSVSLVAEALGVGDSAPADGCGQPHKDDGTEYGAPLTGAGCVLVAAKVNGQYLGEVGVALGAPDGALVPAVPDNIAALLAAQILDPKVLLRALRELLTKVEAALAGGGGRVEVPLLGGTLDAGADVAGKLRDAVATLEAALQTTGGANARELAENIRNAVAAGLDASNLLRKNDTTADEGAAADIALKAECVASGGGTEECTTSHATATLTDVTLSFALGQGVMSAAPDCADCAGDLPFDVGLDGLPLRVQGALSTMAGWRVRAVVGLSRADGPYVGTAPRADPTGKPVLFAGTEKKEVEVKGRVEIGDTSCGTPVGTTPGIPAALAQYDGHDRCLRGTLGFLDVEVADGNAATGDASKSFAEANATLDLSNSGGGNRLGVQDFLAGVASLALRVEGSAQLNVRFRTGIAGDEIGLPSVLGALHLSTGAFTFTVDGNGTAAGMPSPTASVGDVTIDAGKFLGQMVGPIAQEIKKITGPLKPIIDTLQAPLPVLTQLAALVGQPPVTLLSLIQEIGGQDMRLVQSVLSLISFANSVGSSGSSAFFPLGDGTATGGSFTIDTALAKSGALTPDAAANLVTGATTGVTESLFRDRIGGSGPDRVAPVTNDGQPDNRKTTFGVKGLDIPLLAEPAAVFKLLMGSDITLVEYDAGTMSATAGTSVSFGPFFIGPVPITAFIGGSVSVQGRFAMGFDTSGIRKQLSVGTGVHLFDGLYVRDFYGGQDLPEVTLIGTVFAGAKVDIVVASAGIQGGIELTVDLNLNDAPSNDGVMRVEEVLTRLANPICLFDVRGALDAFLTFFLEINLFITTERFDFEIVRVRLLDFSTSCASVPEPTLGIVDGAGTLTLTMGEHVASRNYLEEETRENYTVRQLTPAAADGSATVEISAFGFSETRTGVKKVVAEAASGNDVIQLLPGGTSGTESSPSTAVPFTLPAEINGGEGNDKIAGGDGAGSIYYGSRADDPTAQSDDDAISGGARNETIYGGRGNDTLDGGPAPDVIYGDSSTDAAVTGSDRINGGGGGDSVNAGPGNDVVNGGPGVKDGTDTDLLDGRDLLVGGPGSDSVNGVAGDDVLYGGVPAAQAVTVDPRDVGTDALIEASCADTTARIADQGDQVTGGDGHDSVIGGPGDDELRGDGGNDRVCGLAGEDRGDGDGPGGVTPQPTSPDGVDRVDGGPDRDQLSGGGATDQLKGQAGADVLLGGPEDDDLLGGSGQDLLVAGDGNDILVGGTGSISDPSPAAHADPASVTKDKVTTTDPAGDGARRSACGRDGEGYLPELSAAGSDADCLFGGLGADVLFGEADGDVMRADEGADWVDAGNGPDEAFAGPEADDVYGRGGNDQLRGDSGDDRMFAGAGEDNAAGGIGDDTVYGESGADNLSGDGGQDDLVGGSGTAGADDSAVVVDGTSRGDRISGGEGVDFIAGDNATFVRTATSAPYGVDTSTDGSVQRTVTLLSGTGGGDAVLGEAGNDRIWGQGGADTLDGADGKDLVQGGADGDRITGRAGTDHLTGGSDTDTTTDGGDHIYGGTEADVVLGDNGTIAWSDGAATMPASTSAGTYGDDHLFGEDGTDRLYGQLGADEVSGGVDADHMFGDMGTLAVPSDGPATEVGGGPRYTARLVQPDDGGVDTMTGGTQDDHVYAGAGDDVVDGDLGDDTIEGGPGQDTLHGLSPSPSDVDRGLALLGADDDDLLGGSSAVNPATIKRDTGELVVHGDEGVDVILGDNGEVTRPVRDGQWVDDPLSGGPVRDVVLHDTEKRGAELAAVSGGDLLHGDAQQDLVFGEGGTDTIHGDTGDDVLVGNQDRDVMRGGQGEDDLVGGSLVPGQPDTGDDIQGGTEDDYVTGDNASVVRPLDGTSWRLDPIHDSHLREVTLHDLDIRGSALTEVSGGDEVLGGDGDDLVYGQGGDDVVAGENGDDRLVGNEDSDQLRGQAGEDDLTGGSRLAGQPDAGDLLDGGDAADVEAGDNAVIDRVAASDGSWALDELVNGHARTVELLDTDKRGDDLDAASGNDLIRGGEGRDRQFGQAGNDTVKGDADTDYQQGNQDSDLLEGGAGEDDSIGGSRQSGQPDGDDVIHGGGQADVAIGDNGLIDRVEPAEFYYRTYQIGIDATRWITLLDIDSADDAVSGSDQVSGGQGVDVLFGQAERDYLFGGTEDDYLEGNGGSDFVFGDSVRQDVVAAPPAQLTTQQPDGLPGLPALLPEGESGEPALSGPPGAAGQDDQVGGSSKAELRDDGDFLYGEGRQDFQLGDNGQLVREIQGASYRTYVDYNPDTAYRKVTRYDVNGAPDHHGRDYAEGNDGDDYQWGQDDNDELHGGQDNDDQYGELGADKLFGDEGEDAQVGDRGSITDTKLTSGPGAQASTQGPTFFDYTGLRAGQLDRRVDLLHDLEGGDLPFNGLDHGAGDELRGGPGHDSMHGGAGDDLMNGDSGGDWLFGADGADVMWGGKGADTGDPNARGEGDSLVDYLFGGASGGADGTDAAKADILDYRPRGNPALCGTQADPCSWFRMTETANDNPLDPATIADNQHHGGIDWIYGGDGRDVLQADVGKNGPDFGDRLLDWNGAFNLYTRCNASYGDDGDVRQHSPAMQSFLFTLAYGSGAGATAGEVEQEGTSAYRELSLAYNGEKGNMGKAFPGTPGHFDEPSCSP